MTLDTTYNLNPLCLNFGITQHHNWVAAGMHVKMSEIFINTCECIVMSFLMSLIVDIDHDGQSRQALLIFFRKKLVLV